MNSLLVSSVLFGVLVIAARGPFAFAPDGALQFYRQRLLGSAAIGRTLGLLLGALGAFMCVSAQGEGEVLPGIVFLLGMALVVAMVVLMTAPGPVTRFVLWVMEMLSAPVLRLHGILGVVFGVVWIYLCFAYFY